MAINTTTKTTRKDAQERYEDAIRKRDAAAQLLEAAERDHAKLIAMTDAALDDLGNAAELAETQARVGHLVETHRGMLEAAKERAVAAGRARLSFVAEDYRKTEAVHRKWIEEHDARTIELLDELCAHTGNETWRAGARAQNGVVGGLSPSPEKQKRMEDAWIAGRAARFIEIVVEGREDELIEELTADRQKRLGRPEFLGRLDAHPLNRTFGRRTGLGALPKELKAGGLYPLVESKESGA